MKKKYFLDELKSIELSLDKPLIVFLRGDLGSGKTTLSKHIFTNMLGITDEITSPTYTYYNKYGENYHFDLYRLESYDDFFAIGGEEILDNNTGTIVIEWPDIIEKYYQPDIEITLTKTDNDDEREIEIIKK
ncbi:tRNA (adenosine(37)-N6)-threonylcarbamoyltransferase complex ATPase subunit type 1 TsaE [Candidatus Gracilibacteria bacterium]|nr:tRNA (adenosine(37)-N6)-threonylcarbamoyltransferase complex ATPase subunit type 1 TsaE [Candidatus Gracilibacteria bacterium]